MARRGDRTIDCLGLDPGAVEDQGRRGRCRVCFALPDGRRQYLISQGPLHWLDSPSGLWREYDLRWSDAPGGSGYAYQAQTADYQVLAGERADAATLYRLECGEHYLELVAGVIEGDQDQESVEVGAATGSRAAPLSGGDDSLTRQGYLVFADAFGAGIDLKLIPLEQRFAQEIIVRDRPPLASRGAPRELRLRWTLRTDCELVVDGRTWDGAATSISGDQRIEFVHNSRTLWHWRPPSAVDAAGKLLFGSLRLERAGGDVWAVVVFDLVQVLAASYPLTIDPDTYYGEATDGYIRGGPDLDPAVARDTATFHDSTIHQIWVGIQRDRTMHYSVWRGALEFDTSGMDDVDLVAEATLFLHVLLDASTYTEFDLMIRECAWPSPLTAGNRDTAFDAILAAAAARDTLWKNTADISTGNGYASSPLNGDYINRTGITQLGLASQRDIVGAVTAGTECVVFASQDHVTSAYRPYLSITTTPPPQWYWKRAAARRAY